MSNSSGFVVTVLSNSPLSNSPDSLVAVTSGGITINLLFDAAAMAAPASFRAAIQQAATMLTAAISDQITVNIKVDYSGTGGGASAGPDAGLYESYASTTAVLISHESPGDTIFNALPPVSLIQGQSQVAVWNAQLKSLGLLGATAGTDDGEATFATDINQNLLVGVALHELTHALGRVPYGTPADPSGRPDIFDLFRFTSPGVRLFQSSATAPAAYFSVDGGLTKLADYGQASDSSDFLNSGVQGPNDPFNEFYTGNTNQQLTTVDLKQLDALGFHLTANTPAVIESNGSTSLVQVGNGYFLYPVGGSSGPQLKLNGVAVAAGSGPFASWKAIGAEQTASGYEVAWTVTGADQYTVWNTDSSGNFLSNIGVVSGGTYAFQSLETSFHQELYGDGIIGLPPATVIEANGSTSLVQLLGTYALFPTGGSSGPQLKLNGVGVAAGLGQFAPWKAISAEQTAGGYEVAWKVTGADQYTVWNTDSNGNFLSNIGVVSGGSYALLSLETSFHQDFNGDGRTGLPPPTIIEANGSTSLVQIADAYFLYPVGGSLGPQLKLNGAAVTAGSGLFTSWAPISAEQIAGGYEVAWKVAGADQYTVWNTDSSGNFLSNIGVVSGGSYALQSREASFQQDLNGDGRIGPPPPQVIEANGATSLVQIADAYFMYPVGGSSGPQLPITTSQIAPWTPIGAERTASGYEVAFRINGADQYMVWNTDVNGNYVSSPIGVVSGGSYALQSDEASFHQDLNGDGRIGLPPPQVIEASGSTSLVQIADAYFMYPVGGSSGPQLPLTTSQLAPWTPIGAERTASGYEVAFRINGADQYMVWNTDVNGNYVSSPIGVVSGGSYALQSDEASFHQDLNNDGIIGSTTFDITVNYSGDPTYQSYFTAAAQRWQQVITADLPDVDSATYGHIDDLLISASVTSIDGPGGILGQAGPDLFRSTGS